MVATTAADADRRMTVDADRSLCRSLKTPQEGAAWFLPIRQHSVIGWLRSVQGSVDRCLN